MTGVSKPKSTASECPVVVRSTVETKFAPMMGGPTTTSESRVARVARHSGGGNGDGDRSGHSEAEVHGAEVLVLLAGYGVRVEEGLVERHAECFGGRNG